MNPVEQFEHNEQRLMRKLATFKQLLTDPDLAPIVAPFRVQHEAVPNEPAQKGLKTGNGIRKAILGLSLPHRFSTNEVLSALKAKNFRFSSASPENQRHAVRDALYQLAAKANGPIQLVEKGSIGKPHVYERVYRST